MPTPKPPISPMSDGLHAAMSKVFFRAEAHSKDFGVAKINRVFKKQGFPVLTNMLPLMVSFPSEDAGKKVHKPLN